MSQVSQIVKLNGFSNKAFTSLSDVSVMLDKKTITLVDI